MKVLKGLLWWFTGLMGDRDYQRYREHLRRRHPGCPVPTEAEFWRARYADADAHPSARCC